MKQEKEKKDWATNKQKLYGIQIEYKWKNYHRQREGNLYSFRLGQVVRDGFEASHGGSYSLKTETKFKQNMWWHVLWDFKDLMLAVIY